MNNEHTLAFTLILAPSHSLNCKRWWHRRWPPRLARVTPSGSPTRCKPLTASFTACLLVPDPPALDRPTCGSYFSGTTLLLERRFQSSLSRADCVWPKISLCVCGALFWTSCLASLLWVTVFHELTFPLWRTSSVSCCFQLLDDISENPFLPFLAGDGDEDMGLMEALLGLLSSVSMRQEHGREVCLLIALLLQFGKFEVSWKFWKMTLLGWTKILCNGPRVIQTRYCVACKYFKPSTFQFDLSDRAPALRR